MENTEVEGGQLLTQLWGSKVTTDPPSESHNIAQRTGRPTTHPYTVTEAQGLKADWISLTGVVYAGGRVGG